MNRLRSLYRRYRKAHDINDWHNRWRRACAHCWEILEGEATVERFRRVERHHATLMRLADKKRAGSENPRDIRQWRSPGPC